MMIHPLFSFSNGSIIIITIIAIKMLKSFSSSSSDHSSAETSEETEPEIPISPALHLAASSSPRRWRYDVFPSFRGEDVRRRFLSHFRKEFRRRGITTFDDNVMERSESIAHLLVRAIEESRMAIVVLSKNYASSSWCLNELLHIMRCKDSAGLKVFPIFYDVDPSDVRKQTGDFGRAFEGTCVGKSEEERRRWSQALTDAAGLAGEHSLSWDGEADMIEKIASVVSERLNFTPSRDFDDFVGMGCHMKNLEQLMCLESDEVRFVGMWGPAGIGKTTIARALFQRLSPDFNFTSFLGNVRGICERAGQYSSQLQLQQLLLSEIPELKDMKVHHLGTLRERLSDQKVLLVLDDVDALGQLQASAGDPNWFGPGSRIIATTQNRKLLKAHGINHVYEVPFPSESLEIFCRYAFRQSSPPDGFRDLAVDVARLAGDLPLALSVLGSSLRGESKEEWELALPRLRSTLDGEVEKTLKVGFDSLCHKDRSLFLHIACLFNNEEVGYLSQLFGKSELNVEFGLKVLEERSLIHIYEGKAVMHSLLEKMGKEIIRGESDDPGRRQFVWDDEDVHQVLSENTGTEILSGISLCMSELTDELCVSDSTFQRMPNLKFLRFVAYDGKVKLLNVSEEGLSYLPSKLSLLEWRYYPLKTMPCRFRPKCLVRLVMRRSKLEKLWDGIQPLGTLKHIDLSGSRSLKEISDLSNAVNLETLNLFGCSSLVTLCHFSNTKKLRDLDLSGCLSLLELPDLSNAVNLENLDLNNCSSLVVLSDLSNAKKLRRLDLHSCSSLLKLPDLSNAVNLENLDLSNCSSLVVLSDLPNAKKLQKLDLRGCSSLLKLPDLSNVVYLENLNLSYCSSLVVFATSLRELDMDMEECTNLEISKNIRSLYVNDTTVGEVPYSIPQWTYCLTIVRMVGCRNLRRFPCFPASLKHLYLSGTGIEEVPPWIHEISSLVTLVMSSCEELKIISPNVCHLKHLHLLDFSGCKGVSSFPAEIFSAVGLCLRNIHRKSLPEGLPERCSASVPFLDLSGCDFESIPDYIKHLSQLKTLWLNNCENLVSLPELPESLCFLYASNCESLERIYGSFPSQGEVLDFTNCVKLNKEAREVIGRATGFKKVILPRSEIPSDTSPP
ncbi:PREDICTED: disease resistance protein TAO1-like isoform X1 [Tarenaya hassleriana]|uniref:disease resistance protein TAO1-like isoform X1 n=2 Tax=Tarenaya hassleriana TaxID=28532 RepID=UPI00053C4C29|nr:PREDICTED: disease resistance protein TAO1-like isoform X1 [Tarenaya hassleriana]